MMTKKMTEAIDALIERMGDEPFLVPDVTPVTPARVTKTEVFHYLRDLCDDGVLTHTNKGYIKRSRTDAGIWPCGRYEVYDMEDSRGDRERLNGFHTREEAVACSQHFSGSVVLDRADRFGS